MPLHLRACSSVDLVWSLLLMWCVVRACVCAVWKGCVCACTVYANACGSCIRVVCDNMPQLELSFTINAWFIIDWSMILSCHCQEQTLVNKYREASSIKDYPTSTMRTPEHTPEHTSKWTQDQNEEWKAKLIKKKTIHLVHSRRAMCQSKMLISSYPRTLPRRRLP